MISRSVTLITFIFISGYVNSAELTAGELHEFCKEYGNGDASSLMCGSYIRGSIDGKRIGFFGGYISGKSRGKTDQEDIKKIQSEATAEAYKLKEAGYDLGYCDKYITINQIVLVVAKYLKNNPESHHYRASTQVDIALSKAFPWPCK